MRGMIGGRRCRLWVMSGRRDFATRDQLYIQKQTPHGRHLRREVNGSESVGDDYAVLFTAMRCSDGTLPRIFSLHCREAAAVGDYRILRADRLFRHGERGPHSQSGPCPSGYDFWRRDADQCLAADKEDRGIRGMAN
jgi:hypothetical protein